MARLFAQLTRVPPIYKCIVNGFIRQNENKLQSVPLVIHSIIVLYLFHSEYFKSCSQRANILEHGTVFSSTISDVSTWQLPLIETMKHNVTTEYSTWKYFRFYNYAVGNVNISSISPCVATWGFRIKGFQSSIRYGGLCIGLISNSTKLNGALYPDTFWVTDEPNYMVQSDGIGFRCIQNWMGAQVSQTYPFKSGDKVTMKLNTQEGQIFVQVNDLPELIIVDGIKKDKDINYTMAVSLRNLYMEVCLEYFELVTY